MNRGFHKIGQFSKATKGVVTIEFVIVLPIIFAALFLVYEFGRALLAFEIASHDVRTAIRYLTRVESVDFSTTTSAQTAEDAAANLAQTGNPTTSPSCPASYPPSGSTNCHYPWTSSSTISISTTSFTSTNYNTNGYVVSMTASVPMALSFLAFLGAPTGYTLSVSENSQYIGD